MPTVASFSTAHLDGPAAELRARTARYRVAQPLRHLQRLLNDGNTAPNAQAYIAARKDYQIILYNADRQSRALGVTTLASDFLLVDTP